MRWLYLVGLLGMNVLWAGSYSAFKALSARLTPGEIVTWRFALASIALLLLWRWLPGAVPRGRQLGRAALMGVLVFVAGPRLQVWGVHLGRAGDCSVVVALEPLVTAVAAAVFLREHVPARRWIGFGVGMVGIIVLNGAWSFELQRGMLLASLVFLSSFFCESAFSVIGKPLLNEASPIKVVAVSLWIGTGVNLLFDGLNSARKAAQLTAVDWGGLLFLAWVCTLVGYTFWYVVIREVEVNLAAMTILVQPVFGVLYAGWFLREPLHWGQLWGTTVIMLGLVLGMKVRDSSLPRTQPVLNLSQR